MAAEKKVWWVPYNRRPDHPTLHHKNSPLTTPIPGPEEVYPQAPAFSPTPAGNVTNCKKRPREPCTCAICRRPKTHRNVKKQTYESALSPAWHTEGEDQRAIQATTPTTQDVSGATTPIQVTGRGQKKQAVRKKNLPQTYSPPYTSTKALHFHQCPCLWPQALHFRSTQQHTHSTWAHLKSSSTFTPQSTPPGDWYSKRMDSQTSELRLGKA